MPGVQAIGSVSQGMMPVVIVGIVVGVLALGIIAFGIWFLRLEKGKSKWPTVPAEIIHSSVMKTTLGTGAGETVHDAWRPDVVFRYSVDGETYEGTNVSTTDATTTSRTSVEKIVERYPEGKELSVRYKPGTPSYAIIEVEPSLIPWIVIGVGLFLLAFGVLAIWLGLQG